jgi:hypothetical protein
VALGQPAGDLSYTSQRNPRIPVTIEDARRADIREILLYASSDQGKNWQQAGAIAPEKGGFTFYANNDGVYWLSVAFISKAGVQLPDDKAIMTGAPDLKLVIDTLKPIVKTIHAQRDGDDVLVTWEVQEQNPDLSPAGMVLEYQPKEAVGEQWQAIPIKPSLKGQARMRVASKQALAIRLTVRDLAKNQSHGFAETAGTIALAGFTDKQPTEIFPPKKIDDAKPIIPPPADPGSTPFVPEKVFVPPPKDIEPPKTIGSEKPIPPPPNLIKENPVEKVIADTRTPPPSDPPKVVPQPPSGLVPASGDGKPVAVTTPARKPLPGLQFVSNHQVMLEYELKRVGPAGIGGIELWLTKNDGESWEQFAEDDDLPSGLSQGRQKRAVEFRDSSDRPFADGVYGLILVVKNRAGLGRKPRPGDVPEIRIEIDTKPPDGQLFPLAPDPQHPDQVLLRWIAEDKNLTPQPITLEYAERRDGPWQPIQSDIENTGRYSWKVPPTTPVQVYLRLRVRDRAGNEGVAVTAQPQFVDLTEPEGALIGVQPQPKRP